EEAGSGERQIWLLNLGVSSPAVSAHRSWVILTEETMSALYYVLGAVAKMNASMWRYRINFLPINVLVVGLLVYGGVASLTSAIESMHNASSPLSVSVGQIHDDASRVQNYVAVTGLDVPIAVYQYESTSAGGEVRTIERSWAPVLDRDNPRIL